MAAAAREVLELRGTLEVLYTHQKAGGGRGARLQKSKGVFSNEAHSRKAPFENRVWERNGGRELTAWTDGFPAARAVALWVSASEYVSPDRLWIFEGVESSPAIQTLHQVKLPVSNAVVSNRGTAHLHFGAPSRN